MNEIEQLQTTIRRLEAEQDKIVQTLSESSDAHSEKIRELSIVRKISDILRVAPDKETICMRIVSIIIEDTPAENCSLWLMEEDGLYVELTSARGQTDTDASYVADPGAPDAMRLEVGEGIAGWVAKNGYPLLIKDVARSSLFKKKETGISSQIHSILCLPIKERGKVIGVLNVSHPDIGAFSKNNRLSLSIIADQSSMVFSVMLLFNRINVFNKQLERIVGELAEANDKMRKEIVERKKKEKQINYMSYHDSLTGLPNRNQFNETLKREIAVAKRNGYSFAVLFIDIDGFKKINDTTGHATGDAILRQMADRLGKCVRESDMLARHGGDEFILMLPVIGEVGELVDKTVQRVMDVFGPPFIFHRRKFFVTTSIGITMYPQDGKTVATLVKNADIAMYNAKDHGRNNFQYFNYAMNKKVIQRHKIENDLRKALDQNEIYVYYQPKVDLGTGKIRGAEALVRWRRNGQVVSLGDYILIAEETGLILPLGEFVLKNACKQLGIWNSNGQTDMTVSVNVSARQLDKQNIVELALASIREARIAPESLCVEITESAIMNDTHKAMKALTSLRSIGVKISMDDFGTGYSSFGNLRAFPLDELKIDRMFVHNIPGDRQDMAIARGIVDMAHNLGLIVVAEGIEKESQRNFFRSIDCDQMQGYLFSKPVEAEEVSRMLIGQCPG
ncbi:diguanylate cyclase/phosphodiesterase (GGDEF & EAL domains) with PAS/PAC sensor(s) [hydrothermal vent metagenome]|uniref:Diguanylate cyclase/phosphodiesterase (GGDEF & EAL domains) with PAS/PAC sensor(S) n=1 Tax=hydrothermal vent metagenome TaxID=652676 RepID=A0A3B1CDR3_9ZZZZ